MGGQNQCGRVRIMSDEKIEILQITEARQKELLLDAVDKMTQVLYFWFQQSVDIGDDEQVAAFISRMWDVSMLCVSAMGLRPIGVSPDTGEIFAQINPIASVKELISEKIENDGDESFFEDDFDDKIARHQPEVDIDENPDGSVKSIDLGAWESIFTVAKQ
jgi:hypothetical protein